MKKMLKTAAIWAVITSMVVTSAAESVYLSGYARNYTGMLLHDKNEYSILQNTFNLKFEHSRSQVAFVTNLYVYQYSGTELEIGLRELYLDLLFDKMDLRIGQQQIIWGKADGMFITDIVSPKNLSEFLLPDFDEIRIGVTSLKADYYIGNLTFEAVWIPAFSPTIIPDENSLWFSMPTFPVQPTFDFSQKAIESNLKNSELFTKFAGITSFVDFEIMVGYAWDDDPTLHIQKTIDPETMQPSSITVTPRHHRLTIGGGSFSTTLGPFVLRGESAYYAGKYFQTTAPGATDGVTDKDYLHYLLGLDFTIGEIRISSQFVQQVIADYDKHLVNSEFENTATLLLSRTFFRETLKLELFSYIGLDNKDALIRPKISYDLTDGFQVQAGANLFNGSDGRFGQYDDNDMLYFKIKYSF